MTNYWQPNFLGIHTAGNVGIGTTLATDKLFVGGNVNITGVVTAASFYGDGSNLTGVGGTVAISTTAPSAPDVGDLWWDSDTGKLAIYYQDINSSQWVTASGNSGPTGPAGAQGAAGAQALRVLKDTKV